MEPKERELLEGMGNCFAACRSDFDGTLGMVAGARGLSPAEVLARLLAMRQRYARDPEYERLRSRFPPDFPV